MKKFLFCLSMLFVAASVCLTTSCDDEDVLNEYYTGVITLPSAAPNSYTFKVDGKDVTLGQLKDILNSFNTPIDLTVSLVNPNGNLI